MGRRRGGPGRAGESFSARKPLASLSLIHIFATQIQQRLAGEPITDRLVSMFDPDARPIRKGKLGKPNEFGYVTQLAEVTENTRRGARGFVLPPSMVVGNPQEQVLLPATISELDRLGLRPREVALDGGFQGRLIEEALTGLAPQRVFIAGRQQPGSRRRRCGRRTVEAPPQGAAAATDG